MIEFCFGCMVLMLLLFGMVQVVRWVMMDLAERRSDHDRVLVSGWNTAGDAVKQLTPDFHQIRPMDAVDYKKE